MAVAFNINKVLAHYQQQDKVEVIAKLLFPKAKHPKAAFTRVLKGESHLDINQIEKLAQFIGVLVEDLLSIDTWKGGSKESNVLCFTKGEYTVKLAYQGIFLSLYRNDTLIAQKVADVPAMTIREFLNYIDKLIKVS